MAKKNNWNIDEMQGSLISDMEQEVKNGYQMIGQGGGEQPTQAAASVASPAEQQPSTPTAQTIPASVVVANGEPTQNINVPIPVSLHQRLKMISVTKRQNMKDLVALAIKEYVERQG